MEFIVKNITNASYYTHGTFNKSRLSAQVMDEVSAYRLVNSLTERLPFTGVFEVKVYK